MKTYTVGEKTTLKKFTDFTYPQGAFVLTSLLKKRDVKVNGARVSCDVALEAGDVVAYYTTPRQEAAPTHERVYEDENIVICDKFSGVTSEGLLCELCEGGRYLAVHRLDRNTQGLIVFAKNGQSERELLQAFRQKRVEKTYLALCKDRFSFGHAVLKAYLVKDAKKSLVKISDTPLPEGVEIVTEVTVKERDGGLALAEIALHTGKTHQIRAHMAHIGCPVLGDEKYGDGDLNERYGARRQRLVSKRLRFFTEDGLSYLKGREFESKFVPQI